MTIALGLVITHRWVQAENAITIVHLPIYKTTWEWNPEYENVLRETYPSQTENKDSSRIMKAI